MSMRYLVPSLLPLLFCSKEAKIKNSEAQSPFAFASFTSFERGVTKSLVKQILH